MLTILQNGSKLDVSREFDVSRGCSHHYNSDLYNRSEPSKKARRSEKKVSKASGVRVPSFSGTVRNTPIGPGRGGQLELWGQGFHG